MRYMRYLDPKNDLTFKKVFGEHKDLVQSLINALLPLEGDKQVVSLEYLPAELVPDTPMGKDSIVDVRCIDGKGRQFIVEMQMIWTPAFEQRVLFNASKAYVRQLKRSKQFELLQPVYCLNLLNEVFLKDLPDEFIHNYSIVHEMHSDRIIEGLHMTFVELPKFKPQSIPEKKMAVLWLKYLTEIDEETRQAPEDLLNNPDTKKALEEVEESAYSDEELELYDRLWGRVDKERLYYIDAERRGNAAGFKKGLAEGKAAGLAEGKAAGLAEGKAAGLAEGKAAGLAEGKAAGLAEATKKMSEAVSRMRSHNISDEDIATLLALDIDFVRSIE